MSVRTDRDLSCRELVELVTDYLEGQLTESEVARLEAHLAACDGCTAYLDQMRQTIAALGRIPEETVSPEAFEALAGAFAELRAS